MTIKNRTMRLILIALSNVNVNVSSSETLESQPRLG